MGWISVKDRLPESPERVLVCYEFTIGHSREKHIDISRCLNEYWGVGANKRVSHWMPLPEPPEVDA